MADTKLTELTEATEVGSDDLLYVVSGGDSRKVTKTTLLSDTYSVAAAFIWDRDTKFPAAVNTRTLPPAMLGNLYNQMRGCVLNSDGSVNYYLSPTDWSQKAGGGASDLTGADGNVMVEIPKFYYRQSRAGSLYTWEISFVSLPGFTLHPAFEKDGSEVATRYYSAYEGCLKFERSITAVADAGGGDITVTTSVQHPLYAGDSVTISGTTSYDGTYTVVTRASTTTFTVTATFVATETGTAAGYVSGKNLDDMTANLQTGTDELASVKSQYPLVSVTRAECRSLASNVGTGWRQLDFTLWSAVQMLYLIESQTFYSQNVLGDGNTKSGYFPSSDNQNDSPHTIAGAGDAIGNGSTDTISGAGVDAKPGTSFMKYRGIENLYGNCWNWADGININVSSTGNVHITNDASDFADDTSTNMDLIASTLPTGNDYIRDLLPSEGVFLASNISGSNASQYITDLHTGSTSSNRVAAVGGGAVAGGVPWGVFHLDASYSSSSADRMICGRLSF
jgi:hypothetical protein